MVGEGTMEPIDVRELEEQKNSIKSKTKKPRKPEELGEPEESREPDENHENQVRTR